MNLYLKLCIWWLILYQPQVWKFLDFSAVKYRGGSPHLVHRLYWYDFVIFFKKQEKIQWKWKNDYIHINLHHLAIWYVKNIFQSISSSSVLKGKVTFIIKQILRFSKIWITSCIWHVINSLKLNKENIKKWINGLSDMIKDPSKQLNKKK